MAVIKATPYSNLKIFHHRELLERLERGERTAPVYIRIKPTNVCNQNCYYCHYKNSYLDLDDFNPADFIPREKMMEIVGDLRDMGVKAVTFSGGGEPTVYPYINETMRGVLDAGIDLSIISNGSMLKGETAELLARAKWVRLSIDSCRAGQYAKTRGVSIDAFGKLCDNIKRFTAIKGGQCELGVNFVVGKDNHDDVYEMARLMRELGANHVKYAAVQSNETATYHAPFKEQVMADIERAKELETSRFRIIDLYSTDMARVARGIGIFDRAYTNCYMKNFICVIAANQKVYYCQDKAYLRNGEVGSLHERSFRDLWLSDEVTRKFAEFNAQETCGEHCVHDDRNIMLNQYFSIERNHINFL